MSASTKVVISFEALSKNTFGRGRLPKSWSNVTQGAHPALQTTRQRLLQIFVGTELFREATSNLFIANMVTSKNPKKSTINCLIDYVHNYTKCMSDPTLDQGDQGVQGGTILVGKFWWESFSKMKYALKINIHWVWQNSLN